MPLNRQIKSVLLLCDNDFSLTSIVKTLKDSKCFVIVVGNCSAVLQVSNIADIVLLEQVDIYTIERVLRCYVIDSILCDCIYCDIETILKNNAVLESLKTAILNPNLSVASSQELHKNQLVSLLYVRDIVGNLVFISSVYEGQQLVCPSIMLSSYQLKNIKKIAENEILDRNIIGYCRVQLSCNIYLNTIINQDLAIQIISVSNLLDEYAAFVSFATEYDIAKVSTQIYLGYILDEISYSCENTNLACIPPSLHKISVAYCRELELLKDEDNIAQDYYNNLVKQVDDKFINQFLPTQFIDGTNDVIFGKNILCKVVSNEKNLKENYYNLYSILDEKNLVQIPYKITVQSTNLDTVLNYKKNTIVLTSTNAHAKNDVNLSRKDRLNYIVDINSIFATPITIKFCKMHGAGNDYIFVDCLRKELDWLNIEHLAYKLSNRHFGIGSDGLVLICKSTVANARMVMYNADGSRGAMCGNAIRCVAKYLYDNGIVDSTNISIETDSGVKDIELILFANKVVQATVTMGKPKLIEKRQIFVNGTHNNIVFVDIGNPHCVVFVDNNLEKIDLHILGIEYQNHIDFGDINPNVEFVSIVDSANLNMRVWERGSGETLACGTGACASAAAAIYMGLCFANNSIQVQAEGGVLTISYEDDCIKMTGGCELVFSGMIVL
ncbi:MAG: diaminopimelate epimerase [Firmicutes bacterium]|nr:diaminopimelate epimerase [Bacillota bacterium]